MIDSEPTTVGVILAGGLATRMGGGDKPMRTIGGRTILDHVIGRFKPQCETLLLNANGDSDRFSSFGLSVIADTVPKYPGPLAGILSSLHWTADNRPEIKWVVSVAGDCPFLPRDLVRRFHMARLSENAQLAVAMSADRTHPVAGLWHVDLREELCHALVAEELRKIDRWTARYRTVTVVWPTEPIDPFFNANMIEDLAQAEELAGLIGD